MTSISLNLQIFNSDFSQTAQRYCHTLARKKNPLADCWKTTFVFWLVLRIFAGFFQKWSSYCFRWFKFTQKECYVSFHLGSVPIAPLSKSTTHEGISIEWHSWNSIWARNTNGNAVSDSKNSNWMNCLLIWIPKCIPFQWRVQKSCIVGIRDSWANTDSFEMLTNTIQPESIRTSDNIVFFPEADVSCENDSNCSFTPASAVLFACTVTLFLYALVLQLFKVHCAIPVLCPLLLQCAAAPSNQFFG